jgi:hypothetical protein
LSYSKTEEVRVNYRLVSKNWNGAESGGTTELARNCFRSGQSFPAWRATIRAGNVATTDFVGEYFGFRGIQPCYASYLHGIVPLPPGGQWFQEEIRGTVDNGRYTAFPTDTSATDALALTRAYKALSANQTHANGLQFLGEFHEVISQLRHPFRAANKLIDSYLDGAFKRSKRYRWREGSAAHRAKVRPSIEKALADSWLETAFGLRPLLADVKDIAEAIARFQNDKRRDVLVGYASTPVQGATSKTDNPTGTSYIKIRSDIKDLVEHSVRYKVYVDLSRSSALGSNERLLELLGFRLDKFAPTAYELIPWSFLVDYVTNIGTMIETGCQSQSDVKFIVRTERITSTRQAVWTPHSAVVPPSSTQVIREIVSPGGQKLISKRVTRTGAGQLPRVKFQVSLPGSIMKYANVLALWSSKRSL